MFNKKARDDIRDIKRYSKSDRLLIKSYEKIGKIKGIEEIPVYGKMRKFLVFETVEGMILYFEEVPEVFFCDAGDDKKCCYKYRLFFSEEFTPDRENHEIYVMELENIKVEFLIPPSLFLKKEFTIDGESHRSLWLIGAEHYYKRYFD